jgi:hypothetical protein
MIGKRARVEEAMNGVRQYLVTLALGGVGLAVVATGAAAQQAPQAVAQLPRQPLADPPVGPSVAELQRWLDAYVTMQAQDALALTDDQFPPFLQRLRAMQAVRRKHLQARTLLIQQLARLSAPRGATADEATLDERLKAFDELEGRFAQELRRAYEAIDQVLDVRQRARFRVFEDQMERRKLDLWARARRGAPPPPPREGRVGAPNPPRAGI